MGLRFDGFLYSLPPSLSLTVRLLSLKFSLVFVVFFFVMGLIFGWMLIMVAVGWPWVWVCYGMLMVYGDGG